MFLFVGVVAMFVGCTFAQDQFCNVRCDVDAQCGGDCKRCVTTTDNERICLGLSGCGGQCKIDSDCDKICAQCINGACGGLPCHADCEKSAWCGEECGACLPSVFNNNRTVCTQVCGAPCISSLGCTDPCPVCSEDGVCTAGAALTAGAVAGITVAIAIVGGGILFPLLVMGILCAVMGDDSDSYAAVAIVYISAICIPIGIVIFALAFGLSLGLSPSICCA
jgi:hypothetical protein